MTFQQLTFAIEVAKCESINKAAEQLYTHQSNVSNAIKQLEDELGVQLFSRTKRGVYTTEQGREFLSYAEDIIDRMSFVNDMYAAKNRYPRQTLRVSSMRAFFLSVPTIRLQETLLEEDTKQIYFRLEKRSFYDVIDDVASGRSEIGVVFFPKSQSNRIHRVSSAKNLEHHYLGESHISVVARAGHPALVAKSLDHITDYPYVIAEETENFRKYYDESSDTISRLFQKPPKVIISANESAATQDIVAQSDGFFLSCTPWKHSEHYNFTSLPLPGDDNVLCHYFLVRKDQVLSSLAKRYIQELQGMFELL